jgi:spoIIIJ-associated protein
VEWVETTGKTVDEAKDRALDLLGVDERDAEFEVVEEPKVGFLGRMKNPARVRARVRPSTPRPKVERRDRRRRDEAKPPRSRSRGGNGRSRTDRDAAGADDTDRDDTDRDDVMAQTDDETQPAGRETRSPGTGARRRRRRSGSRADTADAKTSEAHDARSDDDKGTAMPELSLAEQGRVVSEFLEGLVTAFGLEAQTSWHEVDEDNVEVRVEGENLGLLVGPKGRTLQAVTEVARSIVVRHGDGASPGRVHIDVAGYRQRRREALARFTQDVVQQVIDSGTPRALEAMNPADRKVVHDTVNELEGVASTSEGEEPNRRVVISPA